MMGSSHKQGAASAGPFFDGLAGALAVLNGGMLVALVLLVCAEAFLRSAFNHSLGFAEEVTGYLMVALTLNGAASAIRSQALFQVHFLFDRCGPALKRVLMTSFSVFAIAICLVLAWKCNDLMLSSLAREKFAATVLRTPLWIPQLLLPLGFGFIVIFLVEQLVLAQRDHSESPESTFATSSD